MSRLRHFLVLGYEDLYFHFVLVIFDSFALKFGLLINFGVVCVHDVAQVSNFVLFNV